MPIYEYKCPEGHVTEVIVVRGNPQHYPCDHPGCTLRGRKMVSMIAKPAQIDHMGKVDAATGIHYHTTAELVQKADEMGLVPINDIQSDIDRRMSAQQEHVEVGEKIDRETARLMREGVAEPIAENIAYDKYRDESHILRDKSARSDEILEKVLDEDPALRQALQE